MRTIALWLWYRGEGFRGYQSQPRGPTVQDALESALAQLSVRGRPLPAGRTDLGVHARMQVVRIRVEDDRPADTLAEALRQCLPPEMGVALVRPARHRFHPQWHALTKEYRYRLCLDGSGDGGDSGEVTTVPPPGLETVWQTPWKVSPSYLAEIVGRCVGRRDFSAFHEKSSAVRPRTLLRAEIHALGVHAGRPIHELRWVGDGFGRYQVRYLTGSAVATAAGAIPHALFDAALLRAHSIAGVKAPARGLVLWEVCYPPEWDPFEPGDRAAAEEALPAGLPFTCQSLDGT